MKSFDIRTPADLDALGKYWGIAADEEKPKAETKTEAPPMSTVETAEYLLAALIESNDAKKLYSQDLIDALARAGTVKQHEAKRRLQKAFGKELSVNEFKARIREAEDKLRSEGPAGDYIRTADGALRPVVANAALMMKELPLAFDTFACRAIATGDLPWHQGAAGAHWTDNDDVSAAIWCQQQRLLIPSKLAAEAAEHMAKETPIHPVRDYLDSLEWDGEPRVDDWLTRYMGCANTPYVKSVAAKWLISAVARVMEPGCQADYTLVLEGEQGKRKSTALRVLCGSPWFTDDLTDIGTKDSAMQLQGKWIVEFGELSAFRKADVETVKKWLTLQTDDFRPPYGRRTEKFPRQNVFAASTNKYDWGKDETGLRRFWPVRVLGQVDVEALALDRDQIWAEAKFRYDEGERWYLSDEGEKMAAEEQSQRQDRDIWSDVVEAWAMNPQRLFPLAIPLVELRSTQDRIYLPEALSHCLGIPVKDHNQRDKNRVSMILRLAGYTDHRGPRSEGRVVYFSPPERSIEW